MENLPKFAKHVPHILRQQMLVEFMKNYLNESGREKRPTIQRFHGALLFVDISGFTVLSQKLDIESLKNHINDYFTRMLTIVDKWGGDVIKFAGDALFIIWQSSYNDSTDNNSNYSLHTPVAASSAARPSTANRHRGSNVNSTALITTPTDATANNNNDNRNILECIERAVACALEICSACGHYEVKLSNFHNGSRGGDINAHMFDRFLPKLNLNSNGHHPHTHKVYPVASDSPTGGAGPSNAAGTSPGSVETVAYLDVHAGISAGLMAGIDIGYADRWEYFLAGAPLGDVAEGESLAKKGDVVISSELHHLLHGEQTFEDMENDDEQGINNTTTATAGNAATAMTDGGGGGTGPLSAAAAALLSSPSKPYLLPSASDQSQPQQQQQPSPSQPSQRQPGDFQKAASSKLFSCGCSILGEDGNYCRVGKMDLTPPKKVKKSRVRARREGQQQMAEENLKILDDVLHDVDYLYIAAQGNLRKIFDHLMMEEIMKDGGGGGGGDSNKELNNNSNKNSNVHGNSSPMAVVTTAAGGGNGGNTTEPISRESMTDDPSNNNNNNNTIVTVTGPSLHHPFPTTANNNNNIDRSNTTSHQNSPRIDLHISTTASIPSTSTSMLALATAGSTAATAAAAAATAGNSTTLVRKSYHNNNNASSEFFQRIVVVDLRASYSKYITRVLVDALCRHVHDAARSEHQFLVMDNHGQQADGIGSNRANNGNNSNSNNSSASNNLRKLMTEMIEARRNTIKEREEYSSAALLATTTMIPGASPVNTAGLDLQLGSFDATSTSLTFVAGVGGGAGGALGGAASVTGAPSIDGGECTPVAGAGHNQGLLYTSAGAAAEIAGATAAAGVGSSNRRHTSFEAVATANTLLNNLLLHHETAAAAGMANSSFKQQAVSGELRSVTVMFIKIDTINLHLLEENPQSVSSMVMTSLMAPPPVGVVAGSSMDGGVGSPLAVRSSPRVSMINGVPVLTASNTLNGNGNGDSSRKSNTASPTVGQPGGTGGIPAEKELERIFGFVPRSEIEKTADDAILSTLQHCFEVLHKAIYNTGGQMRQFIVDDKGTVCIATYGLRGAVSVDNAASAMDAAQDIIQDLQTLQLTASIGITTGKAYCGLVGSSLRHEYAVMGPSTNLSARLMCKALPNAVICDEDTMNRDRSHEYQELMEITAKGYSHPVQTYSPIFLREGSGKVNKRFMVSYQSRLDLHKAAKRKQSNTGLSSGNRRLSVATGGGVGGNSRSSSMASNSSAASYSATNYFSHHYSNNNNGNGRSSRLVRYTVSISALPSLVFRAVTIPFLSLQDLMLRSSMIIRGSSTPAGGSGHRRNETASDRVLRSLVETEIYFEEEDFKGGMMTKAIYNSNNGNGNSNGNHHISSQTTETITVDSLANNNNNNSNNNNNHHNNNNNNNFNSNNNNQPILNRRLYGRKRELKKVIHGLFPTAHPKSKHMFDVTEACRIVIVRGGMGTGKTAFLSGFAQKLRTTAQEDKKRFFNVFTAIGKATPSSKVGGDSFSFWTPLISNLLKILTKDMENGLSSVSEKHDNKPATAASMTAAGAGTNKPIMSPIRAGGAGGGGRQTVLLALDKMLHIFPKDFVAARDLLVKLLSLETSNNIESEFTQIQMLKLVEAIVILMDFIPGVMNKLMVIVIEDLQFVDGWSLKVLQRVWMKASGISFLASYNDNTDRNQHDVLASRPASNNPHHRHPQQSQQADHQQHHQRNNRKSSVVKIKPKMDIFRDYTDENRIKFIDLLALDLESSLLMSQEIIQQQLEMNNNNSSSQHLLSEHEMKKMYQSSGGNPLYTVELVKAYAGSIQKQHGQHGQHHHQHHNHGAGSSQGAGGSTAIGRRSDPNLLASLGSASSGGGGGSGGPVGGGGSGISSFGSGIGSFGSGYNFHQFLSNNLLGGGGMGVSPSPSGRNFPMVAGIPNSSNTGLMAADSSGSNGIVDSLKEGGGSQGGNGLGIGDIGIGGSASNSGRSVNNNNNNNNTNTRNGNNSNNIHGLLNKNNRVEEVIYYRFDRLEIATQILLKAAAVAVANGAPFTKALLVFLLEENEAFPHRQNSQHGNSSNNGNNHNNNNNNSQTTNQTAIPFAGIPMTLPNGRRSEVGGENGGGEGGGGGAIGATIHSGKAADSGGEAGGSLVPAGSRPGTAAAAAGEGILLDFASMSFTGLLGEETTTTAANKHNHNNNYNNNNNSNNNINNNDYDNSSSKYYDYYGNNNNNSQDQVEEILNQLVSNGDFIKQVTLGGSGGSGGGGMTGSTSSPGRGGPLIPYAPSSSPMMNSNGRHYSKQLAASSHSNHHHYNNFNNNNNNNNYNNTGYSTGGGGGGGYDSGGYDQRRYTFTVPLEQSSIYQLIIDEQKEYFHERIASFYRKEFILQSGTHNLFGVRSSGSEDASGGGGLGIMGGGITGAGMGSTGSGSAASDGWLHDLQEEAYHWEKSKLPANAIRALIQCGELEKAKGNEISWLLLLRQAYALYHSIEQDCFATLPPFPVEKLPSPEMFRYLIQGNVSSSATAASSSSASAGASAAGSSAGGSAGFMSTTTSAKASHKQAEEDENKLRDYFRTIDKEELEIVWDMFEMELDTLPAIFTMFVSLADVYIQSWEESPRVLEVLGIAMRLYLAAKYLETFPSSLLTKTNSTMTTTAAAAAAAAAAATTITATTTTTGKHSSMKNRTSAASASLRLLLPYRIHGVLGGKITLRDGYHLWSTLWVGRSMVGESMYLLQQQAAASAATLSSSGHGGTGGGTGGGGGGGGSVNGGSGKSFKSAFGGLLNNSNHNKDKDKDNNNNTTNNNRTANTSALLTAPMINYHPIFDLVKVDASSLSHLEINPPSNNNHNNNHNNHNNSNNNSSGSNYTFYHHLITLTTLDVQDDIHSLCLLVLFLLEKQLYNKAIDIWLNVIRITNHHRINNLFHAPHTWNERMILFGIDLIPYVTARLAQSACLLGRYHDLKDSLFEYFIYYLNHACHVASVELGMMVVCPSTIIVMLTMQQQSASAVSPSAASSAAGTAAHTTGQQLPPLIPHQQPPPQQQQQHRLSLTATMTAAVSASTAGAAHHQQQHHQQQQAHQTYHTSTVADNHHNNTNTSNNNNSHTAYTIMLKCRTAYRKLLKERQEEQVEFISDRMKLTLVSLLRVNLVMIDYEHEINFPLDKLSYEDLAMGLETCEAWYQYQQQQAADAAVHIAIHHPDNSTGSSKQQQQQQQQQPMMMSSSNMSSRSMRAISTTINNNNNHNNINHNNSNTTIGSSNGNALETNGEGISEMMTTFADRHGFSVMSIALQLLLGQLLTVRDDQDHTIHTIQQMFLTWWQRLLYEYSLSTGPGNGAASGSKQSSANAASAWTEKHNLFNFLAPMALAYYLLTKNMNRLFYDDIPIIKQVLKDFCLKYGHELLTASDRHGWKGMHEAIVKYQEEFCGILPAGSGYNNAVRRLSGASVASVMSTRSNLPVVHLPSLSAGSVGANTATAGTGGTGGTAASSIIASSYASSFADAMRMNTHGLTAAGS